MYRLTLYICKTHIYSIHTTINKSYDVFNVCQCEDSAGCPKNLILSDGRVSVGGYHRLFKLRRIADPIQLIQIYGILRGEWQQEQW